MRNIRNNKGFTLIELMIVVVIIGILAALAIPRFTGAAQQARQAEAEGILKQIGTLQEAHWERYNSYATSVADLQRVGYAIPMNLKHFTAPVVTGTATAHCSSMAPVTASGTAAMAIRITARGTESATDGIPVLGTCGA